MIAIEKKIEPNMKNILKNLKYDLKQNLITSGPPPSLKYISLCKIGISLWHEQIRNAPMMLEVTTDKLFDPNAFYVIEAHKIALVDRVFKWTIPLNCKESLKTMIYSLGNEILKFAYGHYSGCDYIILDKLKVDLDYLCWTQQGTVNYVKTVINIIDHSNLSKTDKYELACKYCLEEKVRDFIKVLPKKIIKKYKGKKTFSLPKFWAFYIRNKIIPTLIKGVPAREFLVQYAMIQCDNPAAIQFIWENFANEELKGRLVELLEDTIWQLDPKTVLYFSTKMSEVQLEKASVILHNRLSRELCLVSEWCDAFSLSNYIIEVIKSRTSLQAFKIIQFCWFCNLLSYKEFLSVWHEFSLLFSSEIENILNIYKYSFKSYFNSLKRQMFIVQLLLKMVTLEDRIKLIYCNATKLFAEELLERPNGFELFKMFISLILDASEISEFENKFFNVSDRLDFYSSLIIYDNYEILDEILVKSFSEENKYQFKMDLLYECDAHIMLLISEKAMNKKLDMILLMDKYLNWCFEGNEKEILKCKAVLFNLYSDKYNEIRKNFFNKLKRSIKQRNWNLVERYWRWGFYAVENNATTSKEKMERIKRILILTSGEQNLSTYMRNIGHHILIKRFISCFEQDEIEELKDELKVNDLPLLVRELLDLGKLSEANELLFWCFSSDKNKIVDFKSNFINLFGCSLLYKFIKSDVNMRKLKSKLKWFGLSAESVNMFKIRFIDFIANKIQIKDHGEVTGMKEISLDKLNKRVVECLELFTHFAEESSILEMKLKERNDAANPIAQR